MRGGDADLQINLISKKEAILCIKENGLLDSVKKDLQR